MPIRNMLLNQDRSELNYYIFHFGITQIWAFYCKPTTNTCNLSAYSFIFRTIHKNPIQK